MTDGPNERAVDEPIASSAEGIPDDALGEGEELLNAPTEEEVSRVAKKIGAPVPGRKS
jgi:hypothetical protein